MHHIDAGFQVTGVQHGGKVLGLVHGEVTGDLGVTVGDFGTHRRSGIYELVKHDGDGRQLGGAVVGSFLGDFTPYIGSLVFHGHVDHHAVVLIDILTGRAHHARTTDGLGAQERSNTVVFLLQRIEREGVVVILLGGAPVEDDAIVAQDALQLREHAVDGGHVGLFEVADDKTAGNGNRLAHDGTRGDINVFDFVLILFHLGICQTQCVGNGIRSSSLCGVIFLVLQLFSQLGIGLEEALLNGLATHNIVIDLPEFQLGGALQQVGDTLGLFHAGKFHEDTAALEQLQVGLGHAETVDTGTEDLERAVRNLAGLFLQPGDNLGVGGILDAGTLAEIGAQVRIVKLQRTLLLVEIVHENIDKVAVRRVGELLLRILESSLEQLVILVDGQALHHIRHGDFQGDVHTALQVQTQVQLFVLTFLVSVAQEHGGVVHVGQILQLSGINQRINQMLLQHQITVRCLLHFCNCGLVVCIRVSLLLHTPCDEGERQTVQTDKRKENRKE